MKTYEDFIKAINEDLHLFKEFPIAKLILNGFAFALKENDTTLLGKIIAPANEEFQKMKLQEKISKPIFQNPGNGFDLIIEDEKNSTINSKIRSTDSWYLEQTRRKSGKNEGIQSNTGHVCPKVDECNFYAITSTNGEYLDINQWTITLIPSAILENKKNPGFVVPRINSKIKKEFKTKDIKETYEKYKRK